MVVVEGLTPRQVVEELDKYIVGQTEAKRAVAIALRNRYRRRLLPEELRDEVSPKNILMIGPTGVGKTEIARRLAKLAGAPFVKVEATKFTEVGYVGRDVDSMVRDLVETAIRMVKGEKMEAVQDRATSWPRSGSSRSSGRGPAGAGAGAGASTPCRPSSAWGGPSRPPTPPEDEATSRAEREELRQRLRRGELEDQLVEVEVEDTTPRTLEIFTGARGGGDGHQPPGYAGGLLPRRTRRRKLPIREARKVLAQEEAQKLIDMDEVQAEAIRRAEENGIIFLDEIDKIASSGQGHGPDVSREGVQRDILPIVEGSTVMTKYGPVRTDHILFIAAGAFHVSKPSDLIPELQGRFPIRVELRSLTEDDFRRILTEPENALITQYTQLLATEGVTVEFTDDAIDAIARLARQVNEATEDIGARRLHTIMERVLEELSFAAPELSGQRVVINAAYVHQRLAPIMEDRDLSRYIL